MNKRNILLIIVCAIGILLIYFIDLFKLNYRLTGWEEFGEAPVVVNHVEYFVANTPNIIGYTDHGLGEEVTCYEAVAFVESDTGETYRCCDAGERISCLQGDFSSDIPATDEKCVSELQEIFGVPGTLPGSNEYHLFGSCSGGRFAELTVVQLDDNGAIRWRHVTRCVW